MRELDETSRLGVLGAACSSRPACSQSWPISPFLRRHSLRRDGKALADIAGPGKEVQVKNEKCEAPYMSLQTGTGVKVKIEAVVPSGSASAVSCKYDDLRAKPFDATEFSELVEHYLAKGASCRGQRKEGSPGHEAGLCAQRKGR